MPDPIRSKTLNLFILSSTVDSKDCCCFAQSKIIYQQRHKLINFFFNFIIPPFLLPRNNNAMKFIKLLLAVSIFSGCIALNAQKLNTANITTFVDSLVKDISQKHPIASIAVAIKQDGKILLEKAYGLANVELNVPATIHSIYKMNSISKMFTAISILQLNEQGKLLLRSE